MLGGIENLPRLIEDKCGKFETFHANPTPLQKIVLNNILGESHPLVPEIMRCSKVRPKIYDNRQLQYMLKYVAS